VNDHNQSKRKKPLPKRVNCKQQNEDQTKTLPVNFGDRMKRPLLAVGSDGAAASAAASCGKRYDYDSIPTEQIV
jgi:hypothetical protein